MRKVADVALTEYLNAVRTKAFLIGILAMPILMFGSIAVAHFARGKIDIKDRRFAVVDLTGQFLHVLEEKAKERNLGAIFNWESGVKGKQIRPAFHPKKAGLDPNGRELTEVALSEKVRNEELFAFVIIGADVLDARGPDSEISYYTQTPTYLELPEWIEKIVNEEAQRLRIERANLDEGLVQKLTRRAYVMKLGLAALDEKGQVVKAAQENRAVTFGVPAGAMFLMFMIVMLSAPVLLNTVLEEKVQKISEFLVSCITPFQLMLGKLIGAVMVSLTLALLYLSGLGFLIFKYQLGYAVSPWLFFWFIFFQTLALLIFGSIFSAIGAACSEIRDAQNMMFPATLLLVLPFFTWLPILESPTSPFARAMSLFPPATPMLMMLRIAIPPGPPWWEVALGVVLTIGFMLICVWASAKIFRIGLMAQGQSPTFAKLISWLWSKE